MNRNLLVLTAMITLLSYQAIAQPQACNPPPGPPAGAPSCNAACIYCDFDGFGGINNGAPSGGNSGCPTIALHNDRWYGFIAGSTDITIDILATNCNTPDGLQAAFHEDCSGGDALACNGGSAGGAAGGSQTLTISYSDFVPGQIYYLMIDGYSNCVCNYVIDVVSGSVDAPAPGEASNPVGPTLVCPGATAVYTIPDVPGAGYYNWSAPAGSHINGGGSTASVNAPDGTTVTITFGASAGSVCVAAGNPCFPTTPQHCLPVMNKKIPDTNKPQIVVCYEDLPYIWDEDSGQSISIPTPATGTVLSTTYQSWLGCDSTVKQKIIAKSPIITNLTTPFYICEGQCITMNGNQYCTTASNVTEKFETATGCDSVVNFNVLVIGANAVIPTPGQITCQNPTLTLNSTGSTTLIGNVSYTWTNSTWNSIGNGVTQGASAAGTYHLIVANQGSSTICKDTATVTITSNVLAPGATATSSGSINCTNTSVTLGGSSTTTGVNYEWSGPGITPANQFQQNPTVSVGGTYTLVVTNPSNSCTSVSTVTVTSDNTIPTASIASNSITCLTPNTALTLTTNAASPTYAWAGPGINAGNQNQQSPLVTAGGTYTVTVTNGVNGCKTTTSTDIVQNNAIPTATAGQDQTITCLATNVTLNGNGTTGGPAPTFLWQGPGINGGNANQQSPTVNVSGTYILTVTNPTSGCAKSDTVDIASSVMPPAVAAGNDQTITCATTSVTLNATGSAQGPNYSALWSGPGINASNQNSYQPVVSVSGTYSVLITNSTNGCTATDNVIVNLDNIAPTANAGTSQQLTCTTPNGVTLSGSGTPAGITFLWTGPGAGANNETQQNPTVTVAGTYTLQVTNPINGCTSTDQVIVTQDASVPTANAGPDLVLNCTVNSVNINAGASSSGSNISYNWTGPGIINGVNNTVQNPANLNAPGTYNLSVTNSTNNCVTTDILVIEIDTIHPTANAGADLILNCFNNVTDTLHAAGSSTGANFSLQWAGNGINAGNQNSANPVLSNVSGNYTLTVTNTQNTCTSTDQVTVSVDITQPTADAGLDKTINCVITSTSIGGASSSGPAFSYVWTGPGINATNKNQATPTVAQAGTYNLVVTSSVNGCTSGQSVDVISDAVYPNASAGLDGLLTCAQPDAVLNGAASSNGAGFAVTWSGPGITAANQSQVSPTVTTKGTYVIQIQNTSNSCISTDTVVVDENKIAPTALAGSDLSLDCLTPSDNLDGSQSSTGNQFLYLWTGPGITAANETDVNPLVSVAGNYTLIITDLDNGCTATDMASVAKDVNVPTANAGAPITLTCTDPSLAIDGSQSSTGAQFTYVWQGAGINSGNFDDKNPVVNEAGTYTLIVTNTTNNCTATSTVLVSKDQTAPIISAGPDKILTCANLSIQLDGTLSQTGTNITYAWQGPGLTAGQNSDKPTVNLIGTYTLTVTNTDNGCTNVDVVMVSEDKTLPAVEAGTPTVITCANSAIGVSLNSNGSSTGANFTYLWTGPGITAANQSQPNPIVLVPGNYVLQITNSVNGCVDTDNVTVGQDQNIPTASAGTDQVITCTATTVTLDGSNSSSPGGGTINFLWSGPGINSINQNDQLPVVNQSGTYNLTVTNPQTGCSASDIVLVTLNNQPPVLIPTGGEITCQQQTILISVGSTPAASSYSWSGPAIGPGNSATQSVSVDQAGAYFVTVTAQNGCTAETQVNVTIDANVPDGKVEAAVLNCANNGQSSISGSVTNPPGATFVWHGPGNFNSTASAPTVTVAGTYTFIISSANGCVREINVDVTTDYTKPTVAIASPELIDCNTSQVTLNAAGTSVGPAYTYEWTTGTNGIVSGGNTLNPLVDKAGTYTLVVTSALNGCTASDSEEVLIDPLVPTGFDLIAQDIRCFGESNGAIVINNVINGVPPFTYTLSGTTGVSTNQFTGLKAGSYLLGVTDGNGCKIDTLVSIVEPGALIVNLGNDVTVHLGDEATVIAEVDAPAGIKSLTWNTPWACDSTGIDCQTFTYLPLETYRHKLTVVDENGCVKSDQMDVIVKRDRQVFIPNIFNPNSDNPNNAILMIQGGRDVARIKSWQIFDRWGSAVFEVKAFQPNDPTKAWDGSVRGKKGETAVYVWYAEIEFIDGQTEVFKGDVTLMR